MVHKMDFSTTQINAIFGQKLARARKARALTQKELAVLIKVSRVTVANMERGKQNVQLAQVFSIARALNASPTDLLPTAAEIEQVHKGMQTPEDIFMNLAKLRLKTIMLRSAK